MEDSFRNKSAEQIVDNIIAELDEELMLSRIDKPVEQAMQSFFYDRVDNYDNKVIHAILSDFYKAVHERIYCNKADVGDCLDEVLMLLEKYYKGNLSTGYIAAMMDSHQGDNGIDIVLHRLAEIIKTIEREKYICGVFLRHIDPDNWQLKCEMVEFLQQKFKEILPSDIINCKPEQLVDEIPTLINIIMNSSVILGQKISNSCPKEI